MKKSLITLLAIACCTSVSMAGTLAPILADINDQTAYGDGTGKWVGQSVNRIGKESATRDNAFIIPFALPTLAAGESVVSASISINVKEQNVQNGDTAWNIDVYGVRASNSSVVDLNNDAYIGANDVSAIKVEDSFFTGLDSSITLGIYSSSAAGETALGEWLQTFYTGSVPNQTYAFLRFNSDDAAMVAGRYLTVDSGNAGSNQPALTITTGVVVPEAPVASFTAIPTSGNAPLEVAFSDTSTGTVSNRFWNFGDGFTLNTTDKNISHTYTTEGLRSVQLIVSGSEGSSTNTMADLIDVAPPVAGFTIVGNAADTFIGMNTNGIAVPYWAGQALLSVGDDNYSSARGDQCAVLVYQLPELSGQSISNAQVDISLQGEYLGVTNYPVGLDLYGVRYDTVPTVLASDYAPVGSNVGNGTLLQDDVASLSEDNDATYHEFTPVSTDASGGAALATWIAAQYDAGAEAGDYVFLRLNNDKYATGYWSIISADHALTNQISTLTITLDSSGSTGEAKFVYTEVVGSGVLKLAFSATGALDNFKLLGRADLTSGSWGYVPHSDNSGGPFALGNLSNSTIEGTNYTIYVETTGSTEAFYGIE